MGFFQKTTIRRYFVLAPLMLLLVAAFSGCRNYSLKTPEGFVEYKWERNFKAISADGVRLAARKFANEPKGDLALWSKTVERHLLEQGYRLEKNEAIRTRAGLTGHLFQCSYGFENVDFVYLTAIFLRNRKIYVIESTGPVEKFRRHEKKIHRAVKSLRIGLFQ